MILYLWLKMCQHSLPCSIVYAHCLFPGRAFASLYVLLFLEKEAEIGGRDRRNIFMQHSKINKIDAHCFDSKRDVFAANKKIKYSSLSLWLSGLIGTLHVPGCKTAKTDFS